MTFAAPVVGKLLEKFDIRIVMTISTAMMSVSYILFSQCQTLKQFYLLAIFLGIGSAGSHIIPVSMMVTNWFIEKRGLVMGIVFSASGVGGLIFNPLSNWFVISYGWQTAYLIIGLIMAITTIPTALLVVRAHPREERPSTVRTNSGNNPRVRYNIGRFYSCAGISNTLVLAAGHHDPVYCYCKYGGASSYCALSYRSGIQLNHSRQPNVFTHGNAHLWKDRVGWNCRQDRPF